jgi:hypothetical protein
MLHMCHFYIVKNIIYMYLRCLYRNLRRNLTEKEDTEDVIEMGRREVCCVCTSVQHAVSHISGAELSGCFERIRL